MKGKGLLALCVFSFVCLRPIDASAESVLSLNGTTLVTKSPVVVLTDEFFSGRTRALKILFTSEPRKDHAFLALLIDKDNRIWQVNLIFVLPGQTVIRTVAWKPEELERFSAGYFYDGKRLKLRNKGNFKDPSSEKSPVSLAWDVNVDAPVVDKLGSGKK